MTIKIELPEAMLTGKREEIIIRISKKTGNAVVVNPNEEQRTQTATPMMLTDFVDTLTERQQANGKHRQQETYRQAMQRFLLFRGGRDISVQDIDASCIEAFESHLQQQNLSLNTISFYMRVLRAIYNKAVEQHNLTNRQPFARVFTGYAKTTKRAVTTTIISKVASATPINRGELFARDLFLFSYLTRGMSFVDMAFLKKSDIHNGYLTYQRKKTGQKLRIAWRDSMQHIVERHPSLDGIHLFGIVNQQCDEPLRRQYQRQQSLVNYYLHRYSAHLQLETPLTMYVARHSWATIARERGIPMAVISDSLGHDTEKTTHIYLKSINASIIDRANDEMINAIKPIMQ